MCLSCDVTGEKETIRIKLGTRKNMGRSLGTYTNGNRQEDYCYCMFVGELGMRIEYVELVFSMTEKFKPKYGDDLKLKIYRTVENDHSGCFSCMVKVNTFMKNERIKREILIERLYELFPKDVALIILNY